MNDVQVCHPGAAVDLFIGATNMSEKQPFEYGGGHVIQDLVAGKEVELRAKLTELTVTRELSLKQH